jgi:hypothetical protein
MDAFGIVWGAINRRLRGEDLRDGAVPLAFEVLPLSTPTLARRDFMAGGVRLDIGMLEPFQVLLCGAQRAEFCKAFSVRVAVGL